MCEVSEVSEVLAQQGLEVPTACRGKPQESGARGIG